MGVRYVVADARARPAGRRHLRPIFSQGDVTIYENERALPRAYVVSRGSVLASPAGALARVRAADFDPRQEVVLEAEQMPPVEGLSAAASRAEVVQHRPNRVLIDAELKGDGFLVLGDSYDDGWIARADGQPTAIYRANYAFRAVRLGPGRHRVEFVYRPRGFVVGAALTLLSLAALAASHLQASAWPRRPRPHGRPGARRAR